MSVETFTTATTLDEAVAALAQGARPVAGGTDLVVGARQGKAPLPEHLVAIHRVDELRGIRIEGDEIVIGAMTTHAEILDSAVLAERAGRRGGVAEQEQTLEALALKVSEVYRAIFPEADASVSTLQVRSPLISLDLP